MNEDDLDNGMIITDEEIESAAKAAHEAIRDYCNVIGEGDYIAWEEAPEWQKESAIIGVSCVLEGKTQEQLHQSWVDKKVLDGWVYGLEKCADKKTHPCLVPYDELDDKQKFKDKLFDMAVKAYFCGW